MSNSLQFHGPHHSRLPCPSLSLGVCSNSCPLSRWCHPKHLIFCCPLLLLPSIFPTIRVFSNELALCIRWPKYWSFSFSINFSNEHLGLISFRIDCFDLFAVQGTLKSLLWHHSSKASILKMLSFLYGPALTAVHDYWKNHSFDYMNLCEQSDALLFDTLSRFVIAFFPRSKCLLISWLQSSSAVPT